MKQLFFTFLLILVAGVGVSYGQTKSAIDKNITLYYTKIIRDSTERVGSGSFKILKGKNIEWLQNGAENVYTFEVTEVIGEWDNLNNQGKITLVVMLNKRLAWFTIGRNGSILSATLKQITLTGSDLISTFIVNHFEIN
jgi:hypothetical protein